MVNLEQSAAKGESLLDLRTNGPFKGRGELLRSARAGLMAALETGDATEAATALFDFVKAKEAALKAHMPENADFRAWGRSISDWLYSTDHISVGYGLQYDGVDIEQLSPRNPRHRPTTVVSCHRRGYDVAISYVNDQTAALAVVAEVEALGRGALAVRPIARIRSRSNDCSPRSMQPSVGSTCW